MINSGNTIMNKTNVIFGIVFFRNKNWKHISGPRGSGPIKVEYILDEHRRSQTLTDQKKGLIRKAHELSIMTNTDIFIQLVTQKGRFCGYSFNENTWGSM